MAGTLVFFCLASPGMAKISGDVELVYSDYSAEEDGQNVLDISVFSQKYSLLFEKSGAIGDQRLGHYDLGIGYQWVTADIAQNDDDIQFSKDKILYRGEVTLAPGGLPFRLYAYSQDMNRPTYLASEPVDSILDHNILYDVSSGTYVSTGLTLVAGIRNGTYLGAYREYLSMFPRVFIDYKELYVDAQAAISKQHYRDRNLAFVSLNKKDNWFHYRRRDYKDFIDESNNKSDTTFMLGTIDHMLKRQWVNLTNWIKISVDGSYTEEEQGDDLYSHIDSQTYYLNLYGIVEYGKTRLVNFSNFRRTSYENKIEKDLNIPVYVNGWLDGNRSWSLSLNSFSTQDTVYGDAKKLQQLGEESGQYASAGLTVGLQQAVRFDSKLELELNQKPDIDSFAARLRLEMANNVKQNKIDSYLLGYLATFINSRGTTKDGQDGSSDILEQEIYGGFKKTLTPRSTFEARQRFLYSAETTKHNATRFILTRGNRWDYSNDGVGDSSTDSITQSETFLAVDTRLRPSLKSRFSLENKSYSRKSENFSQTSLANTLSYSKQARISFEMTNGFSFGDELVDPTSSVIGERRFTLATEPQETNYILAHQSFFQYSSQRAFLSWARFNFSWIDTEDGSVYGTSFVQRSEYNLFSLTGRRRPLAKIYQQFDYAKTSAATGSSSYLKLLLGVRYYPRHFFDLGGELSYESYDPEGFDSLALSTVAALNFSKLVCEVRYSYGLGKSNSPLVDERKEHLFETTIKKTF